MIPLSASYCLPVYIIEFSSLPDKSHNYKDARGGYDDGIVTRHVGGEHCAKNRNEFLEVLPV